MYFKMVSFRVPVKSPFPLPTMVALMLGTGFKVCQWNAVSGYTDLLFKKFRGQSAAPTN